MIAELENPELVHGWQQETWADLVSESRIPACLGEVSLCSVKAFSRLEEVYSFHEVHLLDKSPPMHVEVSCSNISQKHSG